MGFSVLAPSLDGHSELLRVAALNHDFPISRHPRTEMKKYVHAVNILIIMPVQSIQKLYHGRPNPAHIVESHSSSIAWSKMLKLGFFLRGPDSPPADAGPVLHQQPFTSSNWGHGEARLEFIFPKHKPPSFQGQGQDLGRFTGSVNGI